MKCELDDPFDLVSARAVKGRVERTELGQVCAAISQVCAHRITRAWSGQSREWARTKLGISQAAWLRGVTSPVANSSVSPTRFMTWTSAMWPSGSILASLSSSVWRSPCRQCGTLS
eukprot:scaffold166949_cov32-Tisochrysis_lutea.AAC.3